MEFTASRHADKLVIFFSYNCLSMSQQVRRDTAEICSVAFTSPCQDFFETGEGEIFKSQILFNTHKDGKMR